MRSEHRGSLAPRGGLPAGGTLSGREPRAYALEGRDHDPPALSLALLGLASALPAPAARARKALRTLLHGVYTSPWPEVAWRFSRLTGDGFPVEFAFVSLGEAVRYTVEAAGPEVAEADRLDYALAGLARLGAVLPPASVTALLRAAQQSGELRYGAWVGGRHDVRGDRFKLYVEVPRTASEQALKLFRPLLGPHPLLPSRPHDLRMVGYEPESARTELYFRADGLEFWEASRLMQRLGLTGQIDGLSALLEHAGGRPLENPRPGARAGFSLSLSAHGEAPVFSLFSTSWSLFGGDGAARRRLLALAARHGWGLPGYAAVSAPLAARGGWKTWHSIVSFIAGPVGPALLSVSLRPPEPVVSW